MGTVLGNRNRRVRRLLEVEENLGKECFFCTFTERLQCHRKDGTPHKRLESMRVSEFTQAMRSGDFVRLCFRCHKSVHWCMKYLHLSWQEIATIYVAH